MANAADTLRERCIAVKGLLQGVQGTAVTMDIARRQSRQLLCDIEATSLQPADVADVVHHLRQIPWADGLLDPLLLAASKAHQRPARPI